MPDSIKAVPRPQAFRAQLIVALTVAAVVALGAVPWLRAGYC